MRPNSAKGPRNNMAVIIRGPDIIPTASITVPITDISIVFGIKFHINCNGN